MFRLCAALTGALLVASQQSDEPTIADELTALIAKTNALERFHLIYDVESEIEGKAQSMTVELVYRAPDLAQIRTSTEGATLDYWVEGTKVFVWQGGLWKSASFASFPCMQLLDESFPVESSGGGVSAFLTLRHVASGEVEFSLSMGYYSTGEPTLLGWLKNLERWSGVQRDGSWLSWEEDGIRCQVSRESGFLDEIEITSNGGHMHLQLREAEIDAAPPPELLTIPEEARSAPEDEALQHTLAPAVRSIAFQRIAEWLELDGHTWNEFASNRWRAVMDALHRRELVVGYTKWLAGIQEQVAKAADGARAQLGQDDSAENRAEVERHATEARTGLEENLERGKTRYLDSLEAVETKGKEPLAALTDVEHEVVEALWSELLSEPVLATFDEKFGEVLRR